jgi:uncharacterized membrane protein
MLLPIHVAAGGLAIVLGAVALLVKKGGITHRRAGLLFVIAMLVMSVTAAMLGNVFGGLMTIYFAGTAFTTVRAVPGWNRSINVAMLTIAAGLSIVDIVQGVKAFNTPRGVLDGVPFGMYFFLATILMLSAVGDVRVMKNGALRGGPRLGRHLWRMCFALFIAAGSFFSIRERVAKVLPEPFTTAPMRALPVLLVFGAMFYWLWKVRGRNKLQLVGADVTNRGAGLSPR